MLYKAIIREIKKSERILQIGCGSGNLARVMIYDNYKYVRGVDAAESVIKAAQNSMATRHRSKFVFGYFDDAEMYNIEYDTVICTEVFEYSDCDIEVLASVKEGAKVIFTIPGYPNERFPRWFRSEREIKERYKELVEVKSVGDIVFNSDHCKLYIVNAVRI